MGKRPRISSEDEYTSNGESDSDFAPIPKKIPKIKAKGDRKIYRRKPGSSNHSDAAQTFADTVTPASDPNRLHPTSLHIVTSEKAISLRSSLLAWYAEVHESRGMPWRKRYDPSLGSADRAQRAYEVWVSEIMLQQTQVATVIPYYRRWMTNFPTIKDLAASDIDTVNGLWKGLGYYSRAARLLSGAKIAVSQFGGRLPDNSKDMEAKIPGIGRYSAGAICSIAYGECVPVLDGNVHRLLSRFLALHAPPKAKSTLDILWGAAASMVESADRPGDVNQALIELGSTVCKVRDPNCEECPLKDSCAAYQIDLRSSKDNELPDIEDACTLCEPFGASDSKTKGVTAYPMKAERKKAREELDVVNVVEWRSPTDDRWFLLVRRPEGGLLAGLHEFPTLPDVSLPGGDPSPRLKEIACEILSTLLQSPVAPYNDSDDTTGVVRIVKVRSAGDVVHVFSHIRKTYWVQWVVLKGGVSDASGVPPAIRVSTPAALKPKGRTKGRGKGKGKERPKRAMQSRDDESEEVQEEDTAGPIRVKWLSLEEVENANIGTGVLKIWRQTKTLWDDDCKDSD